MNLPRIQPINPARLYAPFDHPDWLFELKHDGYRAGGIIDVMRHSLAVFVMAALGVLIAGTAAFAHHGASVVYDVSKPVTLKGTVTEFRWTNPHVELYFNAKDEDGSAVHWGGELSSPGSLVRCGWTRDALKPGDQITVTFARGRAAKHFVFIEKVVLGNGRALEANQVLKPLH